MRKEEIVRVKCGKVLKGIISFYDEGRACVTVGNMVSESFLVKMGLRQGCVVSPWSFNMFMDRVVREIYSQTNTSIQSPETPPCELTR